MVDADAKRWQALRALPRNLNGKLYLMYIQALAECGEPPTDPLGLLDIQPEEFYALAARAGVDPKYRYKLYKQLTAPCQPSAYEAEEQDLYRHFDSRDRLLYIGISGELEVREATHKSTSRWRELIAHSTTETLMSRTAVMQAERLAIEAERPLFNRQYNDTPEARERLRAYLEEIGRMDLMWPEWIHSRYVFDWKRG